MKHQAEILSSKFIQLLCNDYYLSVVFRKIYFMEHIPFFLPFKPLTTFKYRVWTDTSTSNPSYCSTTNKFNKDELLKVTSVSVRIILTD